MFSFDLDLSKLIYVSHWFDGQPGVPSAYHFILAAVYLAIMAAGVYLYLVYVKNRFQEHRFKRRLAKRVSVWAGAVGVVGLILVGLRFADVPYISARIVSYLAFLTTLGLAGFLVFYMKRLYPGRLEAYEARVLKSRYAPKPKPKATSAPPSVKRRARGRRGK